MLSVSTVSLCFSLSFALPFITFLVYFSLLSLSLSLPFSLTHAPDTQNHTLAHSHSHRYAHAHTPLRHMHSYTLSDIPVKIRGVAACWRCLVFLALASEGAPRVFGGESRSECLSSSWFPGMLNLDWWTFQNFASLILSTIITSRCISCPVYCPALLLCLDCFKYIHILTTCSLSLGFLLKCILICFYFRCVYFMKVWDWRMHRKWQLHLETFSCLCCRWLVLFLHLTPILNSLLSWYSDSLSRKLTGTISLCLWRCEHVDKLKQILHSCCSQGRWKLHETS